jgi:hypothetical protein
MPDRTAGADGVDISELAKRVQSLTEELERITHESEGVLPHTPPPATPAPTAPAIVPTVIPPRPVDTPTPAASPIPAEPVQSPLTSTQENVRLVEPHSELPMPTLTRLNTDAPSETLPGSASRDGANLASLKQRVLESSTFGSRVAQGEEPYDPLDVHAAPQQAPAPTTQPSAVPNTAHETNQPQTAGGAQNLPTQEPAELPYEAVTEVPLTTTAPSAHVAPPAPVPEVRSPEVVAPSIPEMPSEDAAASGLVNESIPAPSPQTLSTSETSIAPRPQDPAHEFFDTIEWHARNENAQQAIAPATTQPTVQPTPQSVAPVIERQAEQQSAPLQNAPTAVVMPPRPQYIEQAPPVAPAPQTQPLPAPNMQPAAAAANEYASFTGSEHAGVEFSPQNTIDERQPLSVDDENARIALTEQRRSIEGIRGPQSAIPSRVQTPPAQIQPPANPRPTSYPSTLTGAAPTQPAEAPVPSTLKPIRTFQDDIAQRVQKRDTSVVSIVSAEQDRQNADRIESARTKEKPERSARTSYSIGTYVKIALSGLFIGVSIAGLAFFGYVALQQNTQIVADTLPEYVFSEMQTRVDITGQSRREFMNTLLAEKEKVSLRLGAISYLYLTLTTRLPDGGERVNLLSSTEFFERVEAEVSGSLTRSLEPMMMLGVHVFDGNQPFLIFSVNFFENAFAGMLQWEDELQIDLAPLFGPALVTQPRPVTGTSTGMIQPSAPGTGQFTDEIIRNKEVRVLRNANGKIILLYGFVDRNTLVITTNEFTFAEIVTRLSSRRS